MTHAQQRQARAAALKKLAAGLAKNPQDAGLLFERACLLTAQGEGVEAKEAYLALLSLDSAHVDGLNNFGALLIETGYRSAAKTVYAQAIAARPDDPRAHVNLGNILFDENDITAAQKCYADALACDADFSAAHQGLARIYAALRDATGVARHAEKGFRGHAVNIVPCTGAEKPVELLLLASATGGNIPLRHHIDNRIFRTAAVFADFYDPDAPLPPHDFVFNAIGDADFCEGALVAAELLLQKTHAKVLNPPTAVMKTGRVENARRLGTVEGVRTAKTQLLKKERIVAADLDFPVLLRAPGFHTGQHFIKVDADKDLASALKNLPGDEILVMEYLDAQGADGLHRKYRVMIVDGKLYPLHMATSEDWKVHYFTALQYQAEEKAFLEDMPAVIGAASVAALAGIARALGLDYGGIDFGFDAAGNLLLFEANATMVINPPPEDAPEHCKRAILSATNAVKDMLQNGKGK